MLFRYEMPFYSTKQRVRKLMVYFGTLTEVSFVDDATSFAFMHVVAVVTSSFRLVIDCIRVVAADVLVSAVVAH